MWTHDTVYLIVGLGSSTHGLSLPRCEAHRIRKRPAESVLSKTAYFEYQVFVPHPTDTSARVYISLWPLSRASRPFRVLLSIATLRSHITHTVLAALTTADGPDAQALYNNLRNIYNRMRCPEALPVPPIEEWQGVSHICDNFYCM